MLLLLLSLCLSADLKLRFSSCSSSSADLCHKAKHLKHKLCLCGICVCVCSGVVVPACRQIVVTDSETFCLPSPRPHTFSSVRLSGTMVSVSSDLYLTLYIPVLCSGSVGFLYCCVGWRAGRGHPPPVTGAAGWGSPRTSREEPSLYVHSLHVCE